MEKENEIQNAEQRNNGCFSSVGGCLLKTVGVVILMIIMFVGNSLVKTCTRQQMKQASKEYYSSLPPEERLQNGLEEIRSTLPHIIDEVTTCTDIELTSYTQTIMF